MKLEINNWGMRIGVLFMITILFSFLFPLSSRGQQAPIFLVSWKANSYAPADYQGKILLSPTSSAEIAFELIDGGKIANLNNKEVRWFINNKLIASGLGLKTTTYTPSQPGRKDLRVQIQVLNYNGQDLEKIMILPVINPEIVIQPIGSNVFAGKPYFFNINSLSDLSFEWSVNGKKTNDLPDNPQFLSLTGIPANTNVTINLFSQNLRQAIESSSFSLQFISE